MPMEMMLNDTVADMAMTLATKTDDACKHFCVELADWEESSAASAQAMADFNATEWETQTGGTIDELAAPTNPDPDTCDPTVSCNLVADFCPMAELQEISVNIVSKRVRRQRRMRRALIEKRRRLQMEEDEHQRRLTPAVAENACVTLNGEKYCKEGAVQTMENANADKRSRKLQEIAEHFEERGIDSILPAVSRATRSHSVEHKHKKAYARLFKKGHARKLRMNSKKVNRKMLRR